MNNTYFSLFYLYLKEIKIIQSFIYYYYSRSVMELNIPEIQLEKFLCQSQLYLNRLPLLKTHLNELHLYIEKLSKSEKNYAVIFFLLSCLI